MVWHIGEAKQRKQLSSEGYDVVFSKNHNWFGIIVPEEMRDTSRKYATRVDVEIPVIGFLVDPLGRIFFKATDITYGYDYIENGELNDFFSYDPHGGSSFCTLTTLKAAFFEYHHRINGGYFQDDMTLEKARRLIRWLALFEDRLDRKLFPRHHMYRIGMTSDGKNSRIMVLDPSKPTKERTRRTP